MLKGISPILTPELLKILAEMGHGDELVIGDCNFPAQSMGRRCVRCDGHRGTELLDAILGSVRGGARHGDGARARRDGWKPADLGGVC